MFRQMLYTQWKWSRLLIVAGALAGFSIPLLSVRPLGDPTVAGSAIALVLATVGAYGLLYPLLAGGAGLMLALTTWGPDHAGQHVYALTLPLPRWRYAVLRFDLPSKLLQRRFRSRK